MRKGVVVFHCLLICVLCFVFFCFFDVLTRNKIGKIRKKQKKRWQKKQKNQEKSIKITTNETLQTKKPQNLTKPNKQRKKKEISFFAKASFLPNKNFNTPYYQHFFFVSFFSFSFSMRGDVFVFLFLLKRFPTLFPTHKNSLFPPLSPFSSFLLPKHYFFAEISKSISLLLFSFSSCCCPQKGAFHRPFFFGR